MHIPVSIPVELAKQIDTSAMDDQTLRRRMRRVIREYRRQNPLGEPLHSAGSYPIPFSDGREAGIKTLAWYPSPGCWWSRAGGCTFCNFGMMSAPGDADQVVAEFRRHLEALDQSIQHLHISPGGSFFSDRELESRARIGVLRECSRFPFLTTLGLETRPDELTLDGILEALRVIPHTVRELYVGFGLECRSDLIRDVAVNKGYGTADVLDAAAILSEANELQSRVRLFFEPYVMIKPLFLTESEAVDEAVRTVEWSFAHGAGAVALFLNTVKEATLQKYIAENEDLPWPTRYETPYYRTGIEVLRRLTNAERARTVLLGFQSGVMPSATPRGCVLCTPLLVGALMAHNFSRDVGILESVVTAHCPCLDEWRTEMRRECLTPIQERIRSTLDVLERKLFGS